MSTAVEINGLSLVPIKDAASRVSYSRDYVARLAREGKIVASQIGRQWFVDLTSLEKFSAEASALEEVRRQELRAERKRELMAKESLSVLDEVVARRAEKQRFDALVVTAAVVCLGLFTGVGVYTAAQVPGTYLAGLSRSLAIVSIPVQSGSASTQSIASTEETVLPAVSDKHSTLLLTTIVEQPVFQRESEVTRLASGTAGIVLLGQEAGPLDETAVAEMFSDEVVVEFTSEQAGTVTYGEGEMAKVYPFVRVPEVRDDSQVGTP